MNDNTLDTRLTELEDYINNNNRVDVTPEIVNFIFNNPDCAYEQVVEIAKAASLTC